MLFFARAARCATSSDVSPAPLDVLEPRLLFTAVPVITEFLASNSDGLQDEDGDSSDWIELFNAGDTALDLQGWHLTDDAGDLNQWAFPDVSLAPGQYLVVFASGKDRADADGTELHTNFALSAGGEYLALVEDDGTTVAYEYAPEYPSQEANVSYGIDMSSSSQTILDPGGSLSYLVPTNGNLGLSWTQAGFNDNAWATGTAGIGYENNPGDAVNFADLINTTLPSGTTTAYVRFEFNLPNPGAFSGLTLRMMYDDGFVAYLNGEYLTEHFAPGSPGWNSSATSGRGDGIVVEDFSEIDVSADVGALIVGTNVLAIHALNGGNSSDMLLDAGLVGEIGGITEPVETGYFQDPTPGAANGEAFDGFVADTAFSHDRGFYTGAFNLDITSATPGALIVYTTDGSAPTVDASLNITNGTAFTGAFNVSATTTVRAAAFRLGFEPTNIDTHTYLFLADVLTQSSATTIAAGFPSSSVNGQQFDYGMDPDIVNDPTWGPQLTDALTDIPTISLVTDTDHLFDSGTGIYVNAGGHGKTWERPTSIEMINGDGTTAFQTDAGLRIRGGFSRGDFNPKHSFRLFFRNEYGDGMLNFPMFGEGGADAFDAFDLRTAQNYAWSNQTGNNENHNTFLRDILSRDIQGAMGHAHTRGDYYHLYLNGVYWGLYQTEERPEADYASSYYGGTDETWDAVKASGGNIEATDGDLSAWGTLSSLTNAGFASNAAYFAIQGLNADGSENPALEQHLDIDNLIDFMISVNFTANRDMPLNLGNSGPNNFWAIRPQDGSHGWRWIAHDNEHNLGAGDHNINHNGTGDISTGTSTSTLNPRYIHQQLTENAEYRLRFADRVQALFYNDGPLTVENVHAMLDARAAQMDLAIIAESARWGDQHNDPPKTKATWLAEVDWLRNTFLAQRGPIVISQFQSQGWLPSASTHVAPSFSQHGGALPTGQLSILNAEPAGTIYYTLDGSDPRLIGGGVSASAIAYSGSFALPDHATVTARLLRSGDWSAQIQADFVLADALADSTNLRITEVHYNPQGPSAAEAAAGFTNGDVFEFIELLNTSSETISLDGVTLVQAVVDGKFEGVGYTFGLAALDPGERVVVVDDLAAFTERYGTGINVAGVYSGRLSNDGEQLTLRSADGGTIQQFTYNDAAAWPQTPDGDGPSLVVIDPDGDYNNPANWKASTTTHGTPGADEAVGLAGDITGDGFVGAADLDEILALWGDAAGSSAAAAAADLNGDGTVNSPDLSIVIANFGNGNPSTRPTSNDQADPGSEPGTGGGTAGQTEGNSDGTGGDTNNGSAGASRGDAAGDGSDAGAAPTRPAPNASPATSVPPTRRPDSAAPSRPTPSDTQRAAAAIASQAGTDALSLARPATRLPDANAASAATAPSPRRFDALNPRGVKPQ
ncbi:lamin tail domain-containing protein [Phycisphaeraceae bacterium D3-23]